MKQYNNIVDCLRWLMAVYSDTALADMLEVDKSYVSRARDGITLTTVKKWSKKLVDLDVEIIATVHNGTLKWSARFKREK
jgi:hypothetical protein